MHDTTAKPPSLSADAGAIPTGIWSLNVQRSRTLTPKAMTLWILKNSDRELSWVSVETDPEQRIQSFSWHGRYRGDPTPVVGAGIQARLTCDPQEGIRTEGEFPGIGPFVEVCTLSDDGTRMICRGEISTAAGVQSYLEDFDWCGPSPHRPLAGVNRASET